MKAFEILFVSVLLFSFSSCDSSDKQKNKENTVSLKDVTFLEGIWIDKTTFGFKDPPVYIVESWKTYPDSLSGSAYSVKGQDSTLMESLCIRMVQDKLTYIARPKGKSMVSFSLISHTNGVYTFENKANEYPQKISYSAPHNDSIYAKLDGFTQGIERAITFKYCKK